MVLMLYSQRVGGRGACLPACSIEDGQDDEGSEPPQDEEQIEQLEKEAGVKEHKQPCEKDCLPGRGLGEACILLPPLQTAKHMSAHLHAGHQVPRAPAYFSLLWVPTHRERQLPMLVIHEPAYTHPHVLGPRI